MLSFEEFERTFDFLEPKTRESHYFRYLRGYEDCLNDLKSYAQTRSLCVRKDNTTIRSPFGDDRKVADEERFISLFSIVEDFLKSGMKNVEYRASEKC